MSRREASEKLVKNKNNSDNSKKYTIKLIHQPNIMGSAIGKHLYHNGCIGKMLINYGNQDAPPNLPIWREENAQRKCFPKNLDLLVGGRWKFTSMTKSTTDTITTACARKICTTKNKT